MIGYPATEQQRHHVKMFSIAGMRQRDIAKEVGLIPQTVGKIQRALGLAPHARAHEPVPRETVHAVLRLLRKGHGEPRIATELCLPRHIVRKIMVRYGIRVGKRYDLSIEDLRDIRRDLRESERAIAKKYHVPRGWISRFRHRMWGNCGDKHWKRRAKLERSAA
jgi:hypothetical protein